jgi:hypothetical protein
MDSHAVLWSGPNGKVVAGKLELETICLRFSGSSGGQPTAHDHRVPYEDIESVHVGHGAERLGGRPALVLELASGGPVRIASLGGIGMLIELAEEIGELKAAGAAA